MKAFVGPPRIVNGTLFATEDYDEIVRGQLIDALTTNQGERLMRPDWGCDIQGFLFDPANELARRDTAAYVRDRLIQFVPRAYIMSVSVDTKDAEPNIVYIEVSYRASAYAPESQVTVGIDTSEIAGSSQA